MYTSNNTEYNQWQYNFDDLINMDNSVNKTAELILCNPTSSTVPHQNEEGNLKQCSCLSVQGKTVEWFNSDQPHIYADFEECEVDSQDRTGCENSSCWNEFKIHDVGISAEPENVIVTILDESAMTVDENMNIVSVHCLGIDDCCRSDNSMDNGNNDIELGQALVQSEGIVNEIRERRSLTESCITAVETSYVLEAASAIGKSSSNDELTDFHRQESARQGKCNPANLTEDLSSANNENSAAIVTFKQSYCELENAVTVLPYTSKSAEDGCDSLKEYYVVCQTVERDCVDVMKLYRHGQTFSGSDGHIYMYNVVNGVTWEMIKLPSFSGDKGNCKKSISKNAGGKAIKCVKEENTTDCIQVYKKPRYPEKLLVELKEDRLIRQNTLYKMQDGVFGNNPHVVRVMKDGTVLDVSQWYQCFMPMKTCNLKTKQKSTAKVDN